ncbi:hypothetical protein QSV34_11575 [Porticoccus sp. W117]|uniref:hypothetical protein n=1 Tax=Porticoccus sp. W117 TaxID=3054777 RepID=UPI00259896EE|nr:hypothetical protein [Porticoccus sp. W117]MDM3871986.1 hypothetical protein [Porticoccus sp. W117]
MARPATPKKPPIGLKAPEPSTTPAPVQKPETSANSVNEDAEPLRFAICHWLVGDTLVFSALDYDQNPPQNQHQLLANILRAIGRLNSSLAEPELVQWPLVTNAPGGEQEAKAMFSSLLRGRVEQSNCNLVLVMGQRAGQFLLPEEQRDPNRYPLSEQCQLVVTPGLDEMLADGATKRITWDLLRTLVSNANQ